MFADRPWEKDLDISVWRYTGHCTCGGTLKYKYAKPGSELKIMPNRNVFTVTQKGRVVLSGRMEELKRIDEL